MKSISYFMLVLCVFISTGLRAFEEMVPIKKVRVKVNQLSARTGADTKFHRLGFFERDDVLNVYAEENGWYKTDCPKDTVFYVYQQFIKVTGNDGEINGERVNARSAPSEDSVVLGAFNHKTKVSVLGVSGEWVKIAPPAMAASYVFGDEKFVEVLEGGGLVVNNDKPAVKRPVVVTDGGSGHDHGHGEEDLTTSEEPSDLPEGVTVSGGGQTPAEAQDLLANRQRQLDKIREDAEKNAKAILAAEKEKGYLFKGWVGRLGRVIGRTATHSLYQTENNDLCHMISNNPDIKLEDFAGKYVGIRGQELGKEKRSKVNLIGVSEIVVFEKNPDATGLGK